MLFNLNNLEINPEDYIEWVKPFATEAIAIAELYAKAKAKEVVTEVIDDAQQYVSGSDRAKIAQETYELLPEWAKIAITKAQYAEVIEIAYSEMNEGIDSLQEKFNALF